MFSMCEATKNISEFSEENYRLVPFLVSKEKTLNATSSRKIEFTKRWKLNILYNFTVFPNASRIDAFVVKD